MNRYVITLSMAGYLPESDPYLLECDADTAPMAQVLEHLSSEVERFADQDAMAYEPDDSHMIAWDAVIAEITADKATAGELDQAGLLYELPGNLVIDSTAYSASALVGLGYAPDIDDAPDSVVIDREGSSLDFDEPTFTPTADEWSAVASAINYAAAYGFDGYRPRN